MNEQDEDRIRAIEYKHQLADRFLQLTKDFKKLDKKTLLGIPTDELIELGKAIGNAHLILQEIKQKHKTFAEILDKEPAIGNKEKPRSA